MFLNLLPSEVPEEEFRRELILHGLKLANQGVETDIDLQRFVRQGAPDSSDRVTELEVNGITVEMRRDKKQSSITLRFADLNQISAIDFDQIVKAYSEIPETPKSERFTFHANRDVSPDICAMLERNQRKGENNSQFMRRLLYLGITNYNQT